MKRWMEPLTAKKLYRALSAVLYGMLLWSLADHWDITLAKHSWHGIIWFMGILYLACFDFCGLRGKISLGISAIAVLVLSQWWGIGEGGSPKQIGGLLSISLLAYGLSLLLERVYAIKLISAVVVLLFLIQQCLTGVELTHFQVCLLLWFVFICVMEGIERWWRKKKLHTVECYMVWSAPIGMLYLILLLLSPVSSDPYDWEFVKNIYADISKAVTIFAQDIWRGDSEDFGADKTGFSGDGKLLSGIMDEEKHLMTIFGTTGVVTNVYLSGKIYDTFVGDGWTQEVSTMTDERILDALETAYAVECYDGENASDYLLSAKLTTEYAYFNTGYLFAPLKTYYLQDVEYEENGPNLKFSKVSGYGTEYRTSFFRINLTHPLFYELVEKANEGSEAVWDAVVKEHIPRNGRRYSYEELLSHREEIKESYLQETQISSQVREYLEQVLVGAETTLEKAVALEKALRKLEYSTTPGIYPNSIANAEGFLDYFLLERKKGYCSYFATAFVLLARAEGIPARYVEGFCVRNSSGKSVEITSDMAHAWPEIYVEGVGWIPFEPTPGYENVRYTTWNKGVQNRPYGISEIEVEEESIQETDAQEAPESVAEGRNMEEIPLRVAILVIIVFVSVAGCLSADMMWRRYRYKRSSTEDKFVWQVHKNLWLLDKLGRKKSMQETYEEYGKRLETTYGFLLLYEELLYGDKKPNMSAVELAIKEQRDMLELLRKQRRFVYVWAKFQTMV